MSERRRYTRACISHSEDGRRAPSALRSEGGFTRGIQTRSSGVSDSYGMPVGVIRKPSAPSALQARAETFPDLFTLIPRRFIPRAVSINSARSAVVSCIISSGLW